MKTSVLYSKSPNASTDLLCHSMPEKPSFECPWRKLYKDVILILIHYQSFWFMLSNQHTERSRRTQIICHGKKSRKANSACSCSVCQVVCCLIGFLSDWIVVKPKELNEAFANELRPFVRPKRKAFLSLFQIRPWPSWAQRKDPRDALQTWWVHDPAAPILVELHVPPDSVASGNRQTVLWWKYGNWA